MKTGCLPPKHNYRTEDLRVKLLPISINENLEDILPIRFDDFLRERAIWTENQRPDYKS